jgi:hypothetical protein
MSLRDRIRARLVDDWRDLRKRWSVQLTGLAVAAQATWALVPMEARLLLPRPEAIGLVLGALALLATFFKQEKQDGE